MAHVSDPSNLRRAIPLLDKMRGVGLAGDVAAAKVYLDPTIGPVRSSDDERRIYEQMHDALERLLEEARQERDARAAEASRAPKPD